MLFGMIEEPHFFKWAKYVVLGLILLVIPTIAYAGWLDFLGPIAKAGAQSYIHTIYINAVERQMITIGFWLYAILGTLQGIAAYLIMKEVGESFQSAQKDGKISWKEMALLSPMTIFSSIISFILVLFAAFLFYTVYDGIKEIQDAGAIEYETIEVAKPLK